MEEQYDVAIIGGGPAGSTVGGLLAKAGHRVLIVDREKFPRYRVGESLVPGVIPVLQELGLFEVTEAQGYVHKPGITIRWGPQRAPFSIFFGDTGLFKGAYQVVREDFDMLLLQHARSLGCTVREETRVTDVLFDGDRCVGFTCTPTAGGESETVRARYVVDATGQSAMLARKFDLLDWDRKLKNVAIWRYFEGTESLEGRAKGNTLVENMSDGWIWVIPLNNGTTSVGWVTPAASAGGRKQLEAVYEEMIQNSVETKRLLRNARPVTDFQTAKDWSYIARKAYGPGFLIVGDAAGFVDPMFSTGVFIGMSAARLAAKAIGAVLLEPERETEVFSAYDEKYKEFLAPIFAIIRIFYKLSQNTELYWADDPEKDPVHAMVTRPEFVALVSGMQGVRTVMSFEPSSLENELDRDDDSVTTAELFDRVGELLAREPQRTAGMQAILQFEVEGPGGGDWYIVADDGHGEVHKGVADNPTCALTMAESVWKALGTGRVSGNAAYMLRRILVRGDVRLASQTARLIGAKGASLVSREIVGAPSEGPRREPQPIG